MSDYAYQGEDPLDSWVEVTAQSLGYYPVIPQKEQQSGLHAELEGHLLTSLLIDAQDLNEGPGRTVSGVATPKLTELQKLEVVPPEASFGEWASRPEIVDSPGYPRMSPDEEVSQAVESDRQPIVKQPPLPWRLRHSRFMRLRIVGWLLAYLPRMLRHSASFFLGAATMFLLMKKRLKSSALLAVTLD